MNYNEIMEQYSKSGKPVKNLNRFSSLCKELGNPEKELCFVHIAGTNGKGSVSEYLSAGLLESKEKIKIGKFTSPFILKINERIQVNNIPINDSDFSRLAAIVHKAAEKCTVKGISGFSQFEILTAVAFLYYKELGVDCAVIETGIGGLLDCTNIITPVLSIITAIDYDHADILGREVIQIASHKAGIIKSFVPCVLYPEQYAEVKQLIVETADIKNSEIIIPEINQLQIINCSVFGSKFIYKGTEYSVKMGGEHQILNAVTSIHALLKLNIADEYIVSGIKKAVVSARMQVVSENPLVIIDGAHNPQGLRAVRKLLEPLQMKKFLLIGIMGNKDYKSALAEILPVADKVVICDGFSEGCVSGKTLVETLVELGYDREKCLIVSNPKQAFEQAKQLAKNGVLQVTGSLYLAGYLLQNI